VLTKQEALEILGLTRLSTRNDMDRRYATLVKRYRAEQNQDKLGQISLAYDIVTERYLAPEPENPRMQRKVFGKPLKEWGNLIHYGKATFFVVLITGGVLLYFILSTIFSKPVDFRIGVVGEFIVHDDTQIVEYTTEAFPDMKNVLLSTAFIHKTSFEQNTYSAQSVTFLLMLSEEDVIFTDHFIYEKYANLGVFVPIDELYAELISDESVAALGLTALYADIQFDGEENPRRMICGIGFSDTQFLSALGIMGRDQIATVSIRSKNPEKAIRFIREFFLGSEEFEGKITPMPSATPIPTPLPTTIPTPTTSS
jgi:hypothetical protein